MTDDPHGRGSTARDLTWILGLGLLLLATGLGLRDPWPADEPRFALIARDMVTSGSWLIPHVGGDVYPDKPPLYFWLLALCYGLTGSVRASFLLPSLLASLGTLLLVYDLTRRLWNRQAGLLAALILLFTFQFTLQGRVAQIDGTLAFWTTLSLYCFFRHLLLRHGWHWYALGGFFAGLGVITKGVGFLPLLVFIPYGIARWRKWPVPEIQGGGWQWTWAPAAFLLAIALWVVPMLIASLHDPVLAAYRDEILFHQTVTRYAAAWHHTKPFYFLFVSALGLWLPLTALLPWLVPRWIERLRAHDLRILLLLGWVVLVLLFFSLSAGKRGVYILPALPALAIASGEWLRGLWQRLDVQRAGAVFALVIVLIAAAAFIYLMWFAPERARELEDSYGLRYLAPLAVLTVLGSMAIVICGLRRGVVAAAWVLGLAWATVGLAIVPQIDGSRSAARFVDRVEELADPARELGILAYKEQFLLHLDRPSVNFGHARWREGPLEAQDAAHWLNAAPNRQLLVPEHQLSPCFAHAGRSVLVGTSSDDRWFLVTGPADPACAAAGHAAAARLYRP